MYKRISYQWLATGLCWTQTPTCIGLSDRSLPLAEAPPGAPDRDVELLGAEVDDDVDGSLPVAPAPWCCWATPATDDDEVDDDEPGPFILLNADG